MYLFLSVIITNVVFANFVLHLNESWRLKGLFGIDVYGKVPGTVHSILVENRLIDFPHDDFNDARLRWIYEHDWQFSYEFNISVSVSDFEVIRLVANEVDTVSFILLNNCSLNLSENMFKPLIIPVPKHCFLSTNNVLSFTFPSPTRYAKQVAHAFELHSGYELLPTCPYLKGECHVNFLRKMQSSFGWDWSPAFVRTGLTGKVQFEFISTTTFDISASVRPSFDNWEIRLQLEIVPIQPSLAIHYHLRSTPWSLNETLRNLHKRSVVTRIFHIEKSLVNLWWPFGYGDQNLYEFVVSSSNTERSTWIGFRSVELIEEELVEGCSFYLKINGLKIFAKGSNWVPPDALLPTSHVVYERLLLSVRLAGMNMLRVWGGGRYETDYFYTLADRLGLMIWQDAAFASALYPDDGRFMKSVREEITYQLLRLNSHPSLVIWSLNNENELAVRFWYSTTIKDYEAYYRLFAQAISPEFIKYCAVPVVPSSPSNGHVSLNSTYWVSDDPNSPLYGDIHFYNYTMNTWKWENIPLSRFLSEFGVQSMPLRWNTITYPEPVSMYDPIFEHRQRLHDGNTFMRNQISMHFGHVPEEFLYFTYLSQLNQAITLNVFIEKYRLNQYEFSIGGVLYWMLADTWVAPSWSTIEFNCSNWKLSHYYVKQAFQPVVIILTYDSKLLNLSIVSDVNHVLQHTVYCSVMNVSSFRQTLKLRHKLITQPFTSNLIYSWTIEDLLGDTDCKTIDSCLLSCFSTYNYNIKNVIFVEPKDLRNVENPHLRIASMNEVNKTCFQIEIHAVKPAFFVWIFSNLSGFFEDNGFHLLTSSRALYFYTWEEVSPISSKDVFSLMSLYDTFQCY